MCPDVTHSTQSNIQSPDMSCLLPSCPHWTYQIINTASKSCFFFVSNAMTQRSWIHSYKKLTKTFKQWKERHGNSGNHSAPHLKSQICFISNFKNVNASEVWGRKKKLHRRRITAAVGVEPFASCLLCRGHWNILRLLLTLEGRKVDLENENVTGVHPLPAGR